MVFTVFGATNGNNNNDPDCNKTCDKIIEPQLEDKIYHNTQHSLYPRDRGLEKIFKIYPLFPPLLFFKFFPSRELASLPTH